MNMHERAQELERAWWADCKNTLGEELKQLVYADRMGLKFIDRNGRPFIIDLEGKSVADFGGGPCSLLLKAENYSHAAVFDPCNFPGWVKTRYYETGIAYLQKKCEDIEVPEERLHEADEVWIYNVLQHVDDPVLVIRNAKRMAKKIRVFEWIESEVNEMHPHQLTKEMLDTLLGGNGTVETLNGINGCFGKAYYGTF